jgi:hypothetical protein
MCDGDTINVRFNLLLLFSWMSLVLSLVKRGFRAAKSDLKFVICNYLIFISKLWIVI